MMLWARPLRIISHRDLAGGTWQTTVVDANGAVVAVCYGDYEVSRLRAIAVVHYGNLRPVEVDSAERDPWGPRRYDRDEEASDE